MLKTCIPQSTVLQRYIDVFYILQTEQPAPITYLAFPHINTAISFFKGVSITRDDLHIGINEDGPAKNTCVEILGKYTRHVVVDFNGVFEEVVIIFKPMGINRFIKGSLQQLAPAHSQAYHDKTWTAFCKALFKAENKIEILESFYWHSLPSRKNLRPLNNH